jgi:hypothetical protein
MDTFGGRIISFYSNLDFTDNLPEGIRVMNPFRDQSVMRAVKAFYTRYYNDHNERHLILGINPGRFGAGVTGIPFTDTKRLDEICGISIGGLKTHETSSVFVYEMIDRYGGAEEFYSDFYISSVSPLGFTRLLPSGKEVNHNYYDSRELTDAIKDFAVTSLYKQLDFGISRDVCFCLGAGKNFNYLSKLNGDLKIFGRIEPLEHPRFIMQYRTNQKEHYIGTYIDKFRGRKE